MTCVTMVTQTLKSPHTHRDSPADSVGGQGTFASRESLTDRQGKSVTGGVKSVRCQGAARGRLRRGRLRGRQMESYGPRARVVPYVNTRHG